MSSRNNTVLKPTDYKNFQVGANINLVYPPILIVVGSIGNIISFIVYIRKKYRDKAMGVYGPVLSTLDTIMLWVGLLQYWLLFNFYPRVLTEAHCRGMFFVVNMVGNASHWTIVLFTIERLIAVTMPFKFSLNWNTKKSFVAIFIMVIVAIFKNLHYLWTTDFVQNETTGVSLCAFALTSKDGWIVHYQRFEMVISSILPFIIICISNICIVISLNKQNLKITDKSKRRNAKASDYSSRENENMTLQLVAVSTTFVILTLPLFIFRSYYANINITENSSLHADYNLGHHICHKLWYTNNGINFLLYSMFSKSFRKDLRVLFMLDNQVSTFTNRREVSHSVLNRVTTESITKHTN